MFVSITLLSLTFVVVNSLYIHGLLCVVYKTDQIGRHHFGKKDIFVQSESFLLLPPAAGDASNEDSVLDLARICSTRPRSGSLLTSVCRLIPENIQCGDLITRLSKLELSRSSSNLPPKDCRASCKDLIRAREFTDIQKNTKLQPVCAEKIGPRSSWLLRRPGQRSRCSFSGLYLENVQSL